MNLCPDTSVGGHSLDDQTLDLHYQGLRLPLGSKLKFKTGTGSRAFAWFIWIQVDEHRTRQFRPFVECVSCDVLVVYVNIIDPHVPAFPDSFRCDYCRVILWLYPWKRWVHQE